MAHLAQASFASASQTQEIFTDAGIALGTPVLTLDGELPVEFIMPGDRVITRNGMRKVVQVEVTRVENARVVAISRDSLGVGRPTEEMFVAPNQPILIRDWRAKALYSKAEAMVPASRLCDGEFIRGDILAEVRFVTLRFEGPEVIYAGGMELACVPVTVDA
ncbi:MAG: Hint domain-containing protein [Paracoccaceae bacterium]